MKFILSSFLFLLINASQCTSNLREKLQGEWIDMDDMKYGECPDVIFFHKSGRYIVFNDAEGGKNYSLPITRKGSWEIKNKNIIFAKDANKHYHSDSTTLVLKHISKEKLILVGAHKQGAKYTKNYERATFSAKLMRRYHGYGSSTEKLILPPCSGAILLKIKYNLSFRNIKQGIPSTLIIKDQSGHELWRKDIAFKQEKEVEEILLADMPEAIELTQIMFEIYTHVGVAWELQAKLY